MEAFFDPLYENSEFAEAVRILKQSLLMMIMVI